MPYITLTQVLELIPISRMSVYRLIKTDEFPRPVKVGGRSVWAKDEIEAYMNAKREAR